MSSPPTASPAARSTAQPRRILSAWLSRLAVDRWRASAGCARGEGGDAEPTALIVETAHGPRIEAANDAGLSAGAQRGMMLADARTLCPAIRVAPSDPAGDLDFLEKTALWAQRWGPWSALDPPDGVLVDVSAVAHLFGGEERLLTDMQAAFAARDLTVRLAIAPTAGAAWALSHFGPERAILAPDDDAEMRLSGLPVAALRLDDDVLTVLRRLGLKRLGELGTVGRDALHRRFRNRRSPAANPLIRMDQLLGRVPEPLVPVVPQQAPLVQRRLLEPIRHRELLDQVLADLAEDMARELEAQAKGARRLELGLWRVDGEVAVRALELSAATRDPAHICRLFAAKLDGIDAGFGIETVRLRASWAEPLALEQADVEAAAERHGTSLSALVDRLSVRLGARAISRPMPFASHIPERAQRWQPVMAPEPASQEELRFHARPLKLLDRAEPITVLYATPDGYPQRFRWRGQVHDVARVEGPERIAPEWWREKSTVRLRDYYRIEDGEGRRYWIYRHGLIGDGRGGLPEWFLQGLCA
ncbi:DNA polymerase Y family protein [Parerythrobacter lacustris]|uniref:DNA-directed DNA polymerase n=1 Tax=Parerythrobacter lacustris TaxID=2969984 RepID=A0ABT1XTK6_9SPHN|nr:DNA polymerase Y family protein [Parerythrobacter lacustris]MCR2834000.1 DNA polymerase Y family protein [Parerythrobacter lacustris]